MCFRTSRAATRGLKAKGNTIRLRISQIRAAIAVSAIYCRFLYRRVGVHHAGLPGDGPTVHLIFHLESLGHLRITVCCSLSTDHDLNLFKKLCPRRISLEPNRDGVFDCMQP